MLTRAKIWIAGLLLFATGASGWAANHPPTIAILDFAVPVTESNRWGWASAGLPDLLQIELQQRGLSLLDRDLVHVMLNEQRLAAGGETARESFTFGKLLNAQYLVSGKIESLNADRIRIEAKLFSVEAIQAEITATADGAYRKDVPKLVHELTEQIARQLPKQGSASAEPSRTVRAPNPESLIMFYRGLNACADDKPECGVAYFMNAASLDPDFLAPMLWEIKAYEMAGLPNHAAIRQSELADILKPLAQAASTRSESATQQVIAVLNPVLHGMAIDGASLAADVTRALLAEGHIRVFAYENIGAAVAEQDLRLSSFFAEQNAPRYGRWLMADALLLCRVEPLEHDRVLMDLSLVNPMDSSVIARNRRTFHPGALSAQIPNAVHDLFVAWKTRAMPRPLSKNPSDLPAQNQTFDLRPVYQTLVNALLQLHCGTNQIASHQAMADAFAATERPRLAAYEIEQCLRSLDIHAPGADKTYFAIHRWLFWAASPAGSAAGMVDKHLVNGLIEQLLANYPQTLAAGCMHYNLAISAWREKQWTEAIAHAQQSRRIVKDKLADFDQKEPIRGRRRATEGEIVAATYFLEGSSLLQAGQRQEAEAVFHEGLDFMQAFNVRDFCLPYGPALGGEGVSGYGGDRPGIHTRLEQQLAQLDGADTMKVSPAKTDPQFEVVPQASASDTNSIPYWLKQGGLELDKGNARGALASYKMAVAKGASVSQCSRLATALLEIALDENQEHPREQIEALRLQFGFPPVEASWVEWFAAGRKYQSGRQFDFEKAAACYRGALDFLEHPEQMNVYHLETQPNSNSTALRWGPSLGEMDLLWSKNYDSRWASAAFYLAQCLIKLDRAEEAAQWLRLIGLRIGGDNAVPLLERADWNSAAWSADHVGVRAVELLQELHATSTSRPFGKKDGPYKVPPTGTKFRVFTPPPFKPEILEVMTNVLAEVDAHARQTRLQTLVASYGRELAPAALFELLGARGHEKENDLIWIVDQTAANSDAIWVANACCRNLKLVPVAERLDPAATAVALAEEWQSQALKNFVSPDLIHEIVRNHIRPLYAPILEQIAEKKVNHHADIFLMDGVVRQEKSSELEAAFCQALSTCLKAKIRGHDDYELHRISQVALAYRVPEAVDGLVAAHQSSPQELRAELGSVIELPKDNSQMERLFKTNQFHWKWNSVRNKFEPTVRETAIAP